MYAFERCLSFQRSLVELKAATQVVASTFNCCQALFWISENTGPFLALIERIIHDAYREFYSFKECREWRTFESGARFDH